MYVLSHTILRMSLSSFIGWHSAVSGIRCEVCALFFGDVNVIFIPQRPPRGSCSDECKSIPTCSALRGTCRSWELSGFYSLSSLFPMGTVCMCGMPKANGCRTCLLRHCPCRFNHSNHWVLRNYPQEEEDAISIMYLGLRRSRNSLAGVRL